jgi:hypothetical protein
MTAATQKKVLEKQFDALSEILISKGHDYASNTDVLKVFKQVGGILHRSPTEICLVFITTKILRLQNLLSDEEKNPNHESIRDNVRDLQGYSLLLEQLMVEDYA